MSFQNILRPLIKKIKVSVVKEVIELNNEAEVADLTSQELISYTREKKSKVTT